MADERAGWKRNDEGAWALDVLNPPFELIPATDGGVRLRANYSFGGYLTAAEWRAMCVLPLVPEEATPAIADGTSRPWTPPADISREAYDALVYEVSSAFCEPGPHREALLQTRFPGPLANKRGVLVRCLDDAAVAAARFVLYGSRLRYELPTARDVLVLPRQAALPDATLPRSFGAMVVEMDRLREEVTAIAGLRARLAELEAELSTAYARADEARADEARDARRGSDRDRLRQKLIAAAVRSGKDGFTAVRDADEAMAAMGEREDPAKVARGQASFLGLFDGNLVASKMRDVAPALRAFRANQHGNDGALLRSIETLDAVASWLRGEGAEPPGTT